MMLFVQREASGENVTRSENCILRWQIEHGIEKKDSKHSTKTLDGGNCEQTHLALIQIPSCAYFFVKIHILYTKRINLANVLKVYA
jgi:hypothetical protein